MFREVYYKIKNIFPNVIASSELIILCSQRSLSLKTFAEMIFHPPCCYLLPLYHRMLLQPFVTTVYHQHSVSHTIMEFVTPVFKSSFPFFRTIANILNNTWSIFHLPISCVPIRPLVLSHGKFVGFLTVLTQSLLLRSLFLLRIREGLWGMTFFTTLSWSSPVYHNHASACYSSENSFYEIIQFSEVRFNCSSSDFHGN